MTTRTTLLLLIYPPPLPTSENFGEKRERQSTYGHPLSNPAVLKMVSLPLIDLDGIFFFPLMLFSCCLEDLLATNFTI